MRQRARAGIIRQVVIEETNFMITAEIHARSLAKFYGQYADRHMNLKFMLHVRKIVKKQIDVSF